jgi:MscS family membrane protein
MKWRFAWVHGLGMAVLLGVAFGSVWAGAQGLTNTPAAETTNGWPRGEGKLDLHPLTFGLDQVAFLRDNTFLEQPLWKYTASLVYIALAFGVAWLIDIIINVWLKRWAAKIPSWHDDWLLDLLRGPVKVVVFVIFLNVGLNIFEWPDRAQLFLSHAFILVVSFSVTYVVLKLVDLMIRLWRERMATAQDKVFADQLLPLMSKAAKVSILIVAALLTADNLNIRIGSALAGLSIGGLALGLAAQDTVANLFGAVAIFLDKPFNIGDRIKILSVDGTVESIGLRSTRVRNLDGHHVTIPNKTMGNEIITNITRRPSIKTEINIGLTYETPVEKVRRATLILQEILGTHPRTNDLIISFNRFADSALNIFVVHTWSGTDVRAHFADMQELNLKIKERFDAEKIDFAFPSQTIYLKPQSGN